MGTRLGFDFGRVRIHDGEAADRSARRLGAEAYTVGRDIVFRTGRYAPDTRPGRRLLAHELAHVVQQADRPTSAPTVQRACGRKDIGTPAGCTPLEGFPGGEIFQFKVSCDEFEAGEESRLAGFAASLKSGDKAAVHGLASTDGDADFNEHLSCARALAAAGVMTAPPPAGGGFPSTQLTDIFKHGETPGPATMTRSAIIEVAGAPKPEKKKEKKEKKSKKKKPKFVCGPDVTDQVKAAVSKTKTTFAGWSTSDQDKACDVLVSFPSGTIAWDVVELHKNAWIHKNYRPACATKGAKPPCGSSVQVGAGDCYYAGSANYVIFGVMMKLCHSHYTAAGNTTKAAGFTRAEMTKLINWYKGSGPLGLKTPAKNFKESVAWAEAGYDGWPSGGTPPSGDRNNCDPSCPTAYSGGAFQVFWHTQGSF